MTNTEKWILSDKTRLEAFHLFVCRRFKLAHVPGDPLPAIGIDQYRRAVDDFAENRRP